MVAQRALRPARRRRKRHADRLGAAVQAVLADGDRLPGGGQGRQPAERVRRSEKLGDGAAVLLARQPRRCHAAGAFCAPSSRGSTRTPTITSPASNPVSEVYGERMIDVARIHVYCWDARPYPAFPNNTDVWGDGDNWRLGHWLTGRYANGPLAETVAQLLTDYGFAEHDTSALIGTVPGYVIDRVMAARDALQPLELAYFFDPLESGGGIVFRHRGVEAEVAELEQGDLVETRADSALLSLTRGQETELPASAKVRFISSSGDYSQAVAEARRISGASGRVSQADLPLVLESAQAEAIAETWLFETWAARERASFALPPSLLAARAGRHRAHRRRRRRAAVPRDRDRRARRARHRSARCRSGSLRRQRRYRAPAARRMLPSLAASRLSSSSICRCCAATSRPRPATWRRRKRRGPAASRCTARPRATGYALKALATAPATVGVDARRSAGPRLGPHRSRHAPYRAGRGRGAGLVHAAAAAGRPQRRGAAQRRRRVGGHPVPDGDADRAGHLRAVGSAARAGRQRVRHAPRRWRRARASY